MKLSLVAIALALAAAVGLTVFGVLIQSSTSVRRLELSEAAERFSALRDSLDDQEPWELRADGSDTAVTERSLVGRLLLPPGEGSRGVELVITVAEPGLEPGLRWLLFDEAGRFSHSFRGNLTGLSVSTGLRAELHRMDERTLSRADRSGRIDVGVIDLRDLLVEHAVVVRAAEGAPEGNVRMALCFGLPPVGPFGEPVSLGSSQFPAMVLGDEVAWLLPQEADSVYFLVERPADAGRGREWRSGRQQRFGPFTTAGLPGELLVD